MTLSFLRRSAVVLCLFAAALATPAFASPSILLDATNGRVLSHEEAFRRWYPASLTKLMTAYVTFRAIEAGELDLESPVQVTRLSFKEPPSKMGFGPGSVMTLDNALKMLIIKSANDIATAIAQNVAGSVPDFARRMNAEAARLGMTGTHYMNAHGLHDPRQYTNAHDVGLLAMQIRREFPQYAPYFSIEALASGKELIRSYNMLVGRFPGADGMKTGFVCASGFNIVGSATRDGRTLIAVVLGASSQADRADRAANMLAAGFDTPPSNAPFFVNLAPYGDNRDEPTDLRPIVCSKEAQADRWDGRDSEGKIVLTSPYVVEMSREPHAVVVGLGGATGRKGPAIIEYADVPIPTPRPDYTPMNAAAATSATSTQ